MNATVDFRIRKPRLQLPAVAGTIQRRILVNYRCDPESLERLLPPPFRPKLFAGYGMAGICLIRLTDVRPAFLPAFAGFTSENAAHRIAVEWDEAGVAREGVFIPRRDTDALLNRLAGGKIFPGIHHQAGFHVEEIGNAVKLRMRSFDGSAFVQIAARTTDHLPDGSVFKKLAAAPEFFRAGSLGWSARPVAGEFDGMELHCDRWVIEPLAVDEVRSSFFEDAQSFPPGSATFDSAFLMRDIAHEWHGRGRLVTYVS